MSIDPNQPRGVLHPRLQVGDYRHARRQPCAALAPLIEHYWYVSWDLRDLPAQRQETLPHPNVQWVFEVPASRIYGVHTQRFERQLAGRGHVFGIKFAPGGFHPFLQRPLAELTDRSLAPADCFGPDALALEAAIFAHDDIEGMHRAAERWLGDRLPRSDPQVAWIAELVRGIAVEREITRVEDLSARCGLSVRALQRLFRHYVGVGPKWVINRYRLHEALAQLQSGAPVAWTELALALGYFDQAHFIRDFRRLVGCAPAAYAQRLQSPSA